jgi:hypothetical protein
MSAAVAAIPSLQDLPESSDLARKRRREILMAQRACVPDLPLSTTTGELTMDESDRVRRPSAKKRKIVKKEVELESALELAKPIKTIITREPKSGDSPKKPQMKYDPDVPMTKEQAAVWRREQRRKRNRESAAASRQRQRDRIAELEVELDEVKGQFDEVVEKLRELEAITNTSVTADLLTDLPKSSSTAGVVSPSSSPNHSPRQSPTVSPVTSCTLIDTGMATGQEKQQAHAITEEKDDEESTHKISRPAESRIIT